MLTESSVKPAEELLMNATNPLILADFSPSGVEPLMVPLTVPTIRVRFGFVGSGPGLPVNFKLRLAGALKPVSSVVKPEPFMLRITADVGLEILEEIRPPMSTANRLNGTPVEL